MLALAGVADPGNAGTLVRAAEAAGAVGLCVVGEGVDPLAPKTVRSSAGSVFRLPVESLSVESFRRRLIGTSSTVWGAVAVGGRPHTEAPLGEAPVVVLGHERHGIPEELGITNWLSIPMAGGPESLNVAMAGTVIVFEAARQRRNGRGR